MALKNQSIIALYYAWDSINGAGKASDVGNHTLRIVTDGTSAAPTNSPTEVDGTNLPGLYKVTLTAAEMNGNTVVLHGKSSTSGISIHPVFITTERGALPPAAPGAAGGLPTTDANNAVKVQSGTGANQIDLSSGNVTLKAGTHTGAVIPVVTDVSNLHASAATSAQVLALQNNTSTRVVVPTEMIIPDSGTTDYILDLYIYDENGNMEAPDSAPTLAVVNQAGTDRSAHLGSITNPGTGRYRVTYTVDNTDTSEQLRFEWTVVEGGATRLAGAVSQTKTVAEAGTSDVNVISIAANAITATAIQDGAITANKIASNTITNAKIADDAISAAKIATDAIAADGLAADAVAEIAAGILDLANGIETGETPRQTLRLMRAVLAGVATETGGTFVLKRKDGTTTAVTVVHDDDGNRSSVTIGSLS